LGGLFFRNGIGGLPADSEKEVVSMLRKIVTSLIGVYGILFTAYLGFYFAWNAQAIDFHDSPAISNVPLGFWVVGALVVTVSLVSRKLKIFGLVAAVVGIIAMMVFDHWFDDFGVIGINYLVLVALTAAVTWLPRRSATKG